MSARAAVRLVAVAATLAAASVAAVCAEELNGYLELIANDSESVERVESVGTSESEVRGVVRRLTFSFVRRPYERIRFWVGGTFEDADPISIQDGVRTDSDVRRIRPYAGIGRRTRDFSIDFLWGRDQTRNRPDDSSAAWNIRDQYSLTALWSPDRGPVVRANLRRSDDRDDDRRFRDRQNDTATLDLSQDIGDRFRWSYRGLRTVQDDRIARSELTTDSHRANFAYDDRWFDGRWTWRSEYAVVYRQTEARTLGGGPVDVPVFPTDGLSGRDDTPLLATLASNPALIDDDVTTGAGVNLGLPPPTGDDRPWGIGHEFLQTTALDTLFVWVDRDVRPEVAAWFSWEVYTSPNNVEWTPVATVPSAPFDEPLRRWTLRFPRVEARYVKVVVSPLDPGAPFASEVPDLFVTELDAALRTFAPDGVVRSDSTSHTLRNDTRARLLRDHDLFYEGNFYLAEVRGQDLTYRLSNGLFYMQPIAEGTTFMARTTWETSDTEFGSDDALTYTANITVSPVPRLRYTAAVTGRNERTNDVVGGDQVAVLFYGYATLVDGVDVQVGASRNYQEALDGRTVASTRVDGTVRVSPRDDLTFGANYLETVSGRREGDSSLPDVVLRAAEVNGTWTPLPSVYLFAGYRREWRSEIARDDVTTVVAGWSPFPGGNFRISLNYNETRRTLNDQTQRTAGPNLRWYFNPRSWLSAAYTVLLDEIGPRRLDTDVASATLRIGF